MSIHTEASVTLFIADFANVDGGGKVNALGAGFEVVGVQPNSFSAPMSLVLWIDVPSRHVGEQFTFSIELRDEESDQIVRVPGPTGRSEPLRIQQVARVNPPNVPGVFLPQGFPSRTNFLMAFPNGVQVTPGHSYRWVAQIDGQGRPGWNTRFHVAGPPPIVFGGVDNPEGLEDMPQLTDEAPAEPDTPDAPDVPD